MEHPLPITLGLFWIGLLAVAIFWIGMRIFGSRRSAVILTALTTGGFIAGAVIHPLSGHGAITENTVVAAPPPASAPAPAESSAPADSSGPRVALHSILSGGGRDVATVPISSTAAIGSIDKVGYVDDKGRAIWKVPVVVPPGMPMLLEGWTVIPATKSSAASAFVLVDDDRRIGGRYVGGGSRPDVAHALAAPAAANSGFALTVPTAGLNRGAHHLQLIELDGVQAYRLTQRYDFMIQ